MQARSFGKPGSNCLGQQLDGVEEVQETSPGENDSFKSQIKIKTFFHNAYNGPFINIHKFYLL